MTWLFVALLLLLAGFAYHSAFWGDPGGFRILAHSTVTVLALFFALALMANI